uniref:uncharacterized protein LOC122586375 isoform X1 n=1 Tax=Erigeron canadensis TaxID=72917 RepID=UPI001CB9A832|nr:uncharacterized protein LOC122586375 isoform X1 [Erigeron canadensis]
MEIFLFLSLIFCLLFFSLYHIRRRQLRPLTTNIVPINSNDSNPTDCFLLEKKESEASGAGDHVKKKKKKRTKKKDETLKNEDGKRNEKEEKEKELVCLLYPFTSTSSATQRKIKQQYDQLVKSHDSANGLTLLQVGQFVKCLIEARDELKHKSEVIRRKFTITKALLFKAGRSSFDRYHQQIYKLELEQKRIEEDASVYNWLQQQLKLSPAYKKMLEIGSYMDSKPKFDEATEDTDIDISDISFEELLAQEKKDSFWQKKGKPRSRPD